MNKTIENTNNSLFIILKGIAISFIATLILLFIFSILLTYTSIQESVIPTVIIIITALSILISSEFTTIKIKKNGIINGGIIGFTYIMLLYIISSIVKGNFSFNMYSIIMIIVSILAGMLGGIIGVNQRK